MLCTLHYKSILQFMYFLLCNLVRFAPFLSSATPTGHVITYSGNTDAI